MNGTLLVPLTGTATVGAANGGQLYGASLTAAAATSTLVLREGGASGTVILTLSAVANTTAAVRFDGSGYSGQLHATITGASAVASVEIG